MHGNHDRIASWGFMNLSEKKLLDLLEGNKSESFLSPIQLAHLYIHSALLITAMDFLKEQLWLKKQKDKKHERETSYESFITPFFLKELSSIKFLKDFFIKKGPLKIKKISRDSQAIEAEVLGVIIQLSGDDKKSFTIQALHKMTEHFLYEEKLQKGKKENQGHQGLRLYRTFDNLDKVFDLNYQLDRDMVIDYKAKERLYQNAGVGVQSGYSTILLAIHNIELDQGSKIIDLGSGYGRVGLVCTLLRPDIIFIGYEFVPHRVKAANNACQAFGLQKSLSFIVQDLSLETFKIPDADVYYLYDPFTKETYAYVLQQIADLSKRKAVTTVTKGNARDWLMDISKENSWPAPVCIDDNNLCIFRSA